MLLAILFPEQIINSNGLEQEFLVELTTSFRKSLSFEEQKKVVSLALEEFKDLAIDQLTFSPNLKKRKVGERAVYLPTNLISENCNQRILVELSDHGSVEDLRLDADMEELNTQYILKFKLSFEE